jgi:hypothetical protein
LQPLRVVSSDFVFSLPTFGNTLSFADSMFLPELPETLRIVILTWVQMK